MIRKSARGFKIFRSNYLDTESLVLSDESDSRDQTQKSRQFQTQSAIMTFPCLHTSTLDLLHLQRKRKLGMLRTLRRRGYHSLFSPSADFHLRARQSSTIRAVGGSSIWGKQRLHLINIDLDSANYLSTSRSSCLCRIRGLGSIVPDAFLDFIILRIIKKTLRRRTRSYEDCRF